MGALAAMDEMPKCQRFAESGFVVVPDMVDGGQCEDLAHRVQALQNDGAGSRALLDQAWCAELANQLRRHWELCTLLPADTVAVQCTLFDKSPTKNWLVSLHQDLSIPVRRRVERVECYGWSEKEGQVYVQPPVGVLEKLVAVRVHLDDCPEAARCAWCLSRIRKVGWIGGRRSFGDKTVRRRCRLRAGIRWSCGR